MSLSKGIKHGKEHRKGYAERGKPGRYDTSCRPHGGCSYCLRNRLLYRRLFSEVGREEMSRLDCFWEQDFIRGLEDIDGKEDN